MANLQFLSNITSFPTEIGKLQALPSMRGINRVILQFDLDSIVGSIAKDDKEKSALAHVIVDFPISPKELDVNFPVQWEGTNPASGGGSGVLHSARVGPRKVSFTTTFDAYGPPPIFVGGADGQNISDDWIAHYLQRLRMMSGFVNEVSAPERALERDAKAQVGKEVANLTLIEKNALLQEILKKNPGPLLLTAAPVSMSCVITKFETKILRISAQNQETFVSETGSESGLQKKISTRVIRAEVSLELTEKFVETSIADTDESPTK